MTGKKVIVGMSGGVDSAVCAYLLKQKGYDPIGVTLRTWVSPDGEEGRCCEIDDARRVAMKLGIPYYPVNCIDEFSREVTEPFISEYLCGHTPNPCVLCNRAVKWEKMRYMAKVLQADYIATGHYAHVVKLDNGRYTVGKAACAAKDQTYMLYRLTQEDLAETLMPLGDYTKQEVRQIAADAGLPVAEKADSQEICFVPDGDYAEYIRQNAGAPVTGEGDFVDENGKVLGKHKGVICYTIGQRKGLGLAMGHPVFVKKLDAEKNEVVIALEEDELFHREVILRDVNFLSIPGLNAGEKLRCTAKVRYHHNNSPAFIEMTDGDRVKLTFDEPVRAAAPGQSAVFYDDKGYVIGGGIIAEVGKQ